jgi:Dolichyl-phosphate-mannose-protein mannosyltransferase
MSMKRHLTLAILLAMLVRFALLVRLHDAYYVAGMAQGDLAYALVNDKGFLHNALPGCGLGAVQARFKRLIDVDEYLQFYPTWCSQIEPQLEPRKPEPFIAYMMPGPGILLAGTYLFFGHHKYIYLQVIQALVDALGVLLIAGIGRRFFRESVAICGAYFYAVFVPQARLAIAGGLRDAWMPILLLVTLYCFLSGWLQPKKMSWFLYAGASLGVAAYFRPAILPVALFWILLLGFSRRVGPARLLATSTALCAPVIALLLPWWIRNLEVFHRFIPTNSGFSMAVWRVSGRPLIHLAHSERMGWHIGNTNGKAAPRATSRLPIPTITILQRSRRH